MNENLYQCGQENLEEALKLINVRRAWTLVGKQALSYWGTELISLQSIRNLGVILYLCKRNHKNPLTNSPIKSNYLTPIWQLPKDPGIPLLGIYPPPPPNENINLKRPVQTLVHCSTNFNSQDMETTQLSSDRWLAKKAVPAVWMELEGILLSKICQYEDKYQIISFICGIESCKIRILFKQW